MDHTRSSKSKGSSNYHIELVLNFFFPFIHRKICCYNSRATINL